MLGCRGKVQRANGVIHLIVEQVDDLSADLKGVSGIDGAFRLSPAVATKPSVAVAARQPGAESR